LLVPLFNHLLADFGRSIE